MSLFQFKELASEDSLLFPPAPPRTPPILRHQRPLTLPLAILQQALESCPHRRLVRYAQLGELVERGVVDFDGLVGWFEVESMHD